MKAKKFLKDAKKALVIVAHPDDETIWMGGTILKNPEIDWTIFSLCRASDLDRAPKFRRVCEFYGARGIISNLDDEKDKPISPSAIARKIESEIGGEKFDCVFSHGRNGEYGHIRHLEIHKAVKKMAEQGALGGKIYFFDYVPGKISAPHDSKLKIPISNPCASVKVKLTKRQHEKKIGIVSEIYGFIPPIFETLACAREESFEED